MWEMTRQRRGYNDEVGGWVALDWHQDVLIGYQWNGSYGVGAMWRRLGWLFSWLPLPSPSPPPPPLSRNRWFDCLMFCGWVSASCICDKTIWLLWFIQLLNRKIHAHYLRVYSQIHSKSIFYILFGLDSCGKKIEINI